MENYITRNADLVVVIIWTILLMLGPSVCDLTTSLLVSSTLDYLSTIFITSVILIDDRGTKALQLHRGGSEAKAEAQTRFERDEDSTHYQHYQYSVHYTTRNTFIHL